MKCELCKKSSKDTIKCIECGAVFCENCGEKKRERCSLCTQFMQESDNQDSS